MQHPDEGTIHSWLDGALSAEDAAGVESHVADCPQCAAAVAEARGFIAASSRILIALDDVPAGVIPETTARPARKRDFRVMWRAAAAVLVVAGGSLIVMRENAQDQSTSSTIANKIVTDSGRSEGAADATMTAGAAASEAAPQASLPAVNQRRAAPPAADIGKIAPAAERDLSARVAAPSISANTFTSQIEAPALKVLRVERAIGARRIIYEIASTDTVTLTEPESLSLQSVVVTGVGTSTVQQRSGVARSAAPMQPQAASAPAPAPPLADSTRAADVATPLTEAKMMAKTAAAPTQMGAELVRARTNTISWTEAATGKTLTLSGKLSVERLQEIRHRIETERAASGKKNP
jgi:hypothetical protein